jgi:hypothetical protein
VAAEGGRVGWLAQGAVDGLQYAREISIHVAIPETENTKAGPFERAVAISVARLMFVEIVLAPINFYDEAMLETDKVDDEALAWCLSAEVMAARTPRTQVNPHFHLLWGHRLPQTPCDFVRHVGGPTRRATRATLPLRGRD